MFKFKINDTRTTSMTSFRSDVFVVNIEHISNHFLVFLLLTLNK